VVIAIIPGVINYLSLRILLPFAPIVKKLNGWSASDFQRMYNENLEMRKRQK